MKKCKDCKYFGDPLYKAVEDCVGKIKDPESHICDNFEKSGYNYCRNNAYACPAFEAVDIPYSTHGLDNISELVNQQRKGGYQ